MKLSSIVVLGWFVPTLLSAQTVIFSDSFTQANGADTAWTSVSGGWVVTNGTYNAGSPSGNPTALSTVNGVTFTEGVVTATVYPSGSIDGALVIRSNGTTGGIVNGVLFVTRDSDAYFHVATGGSYGLPLSSISHVALPGGGFKVSVSVTGNTFVGSITSLDGNTLFGSTSITDSTFLSGDVGLYNSVSSSAYDDFSVTSAIPEPSTFAVLFGLIALGFAAYRRKNCQPHVAAS